MWNWVVNVYQEYAGVGFVFGLYFLSMAYLFLTEKKKNIRIFFLYVPIGILLVFFNPLVGKIIEKFIGDEIYYRILWTLPMIATIAYTCVSILKNMKGRTQYYAWVFLAWVMILSGKFMYENPYFHIAENFYHMPNEVVAICDEIHVEGREVMAVFPDSMLQYVRQYDATICMPYGREATVERWTFGHGDELHTQMQKEIYDVSEITRLAKERQCHFIVIPNHKVIDDEFEKYGYYLRNTILEYSIYQNPEIYIGL